MENDEKIYDTLMPNGFKLIAKDVSAFFGDCYDVFSNGIFNWDLVFLNLLNR